eukprot:CAMPEP_0118957516 /NCGR_PEP_ID=MMETSP1169-20130426/62146_1 /TAXON_ID=36882 /ORGANISM="Pyramimonas obovata, Strain CCMP722" /LENGTH=626 /DNA_ID=CAMNT_0006905601 /DNA_START=52 /DNA_END=1932 /DNA_ORIENTATION=-
MSLPAKVSSSVRIHETQAWADLVEHKKEIECTHLRDLLQDEDRCASMLLSMPAANPYQPGESQSASERIANTDGSIPQSSTILDYSHQCMTKQTMDKLVKLAEAGGLSEKIESMFQGKRINGTEGRAVLHPALRAPKEEVIEMDGTNVVPEVHAVLDKIRDFSERVRSGKWVGVTGLPLKDVVAIGIGGSFLGPLFVHTALATATADAGEGTPAAAAFGRQLRFLSNVDPVDVAATLEGLRAETTLVVVISKTFTTAETMLNARTLRTWLVKQLGEGTKGNSTVAKHMIAVSTAHKLVSEFGIDPANTFGFWDWVGGRYSVTSAVGVMPLALQYGFHHVENFLKGAWSVDAHFRSAPLATNLPVVLGLISLWNVSFLGHAARAILPYQQALAKLPAHIQQVSMESNGKGVDMEGRPLAMAAGEIDFGEAGTNGQHSFYQLIHQGRVVPCDFIAAVATQNEVRLLGEKVSNHDELMCNFFAQPDALATGKTPEELRAEGVGEALVPHKTFPGNRPSLSLLLPAVDPFVVGQLLALYEHRVAVQGFLWGVNSFDQWGVELGKVLAGGVRDRLRAARTNGRLDTAGLNPSTRRLIQHYLAQQPQDTDTPTEETLPSTFTHNPSKRQRQR